LVFLTGFLATDLAVFLGVVLVTFLDLEVVLPALTPVDLTLPPAVAY
jgi:hypothetical protein